MNARYLALSIGLAVALGFAAPATADEPVDVAPGSSSFTALITQADPPTSSGSSPQNVGSAAASVTYTYSELCGFDGEDIVASSMGCSQPPGCGDGGTMFEVYANYPDGRSEFVGYDCQEPGEAAPVEVLTPGRILEAFRRVPLPTTPLEVQPPGGRTLVNFDTILHTDAAPFRESVQLLNRTVEFDIEPSEFTWSLGDGTSFTTTDPGRAWREGLSMSEYVSHRYEKAGDVDLQLTTTWSARWRVGGGPWRPVQGTVDTTSPPVSLDVVTARPQLVSYD